jgi:hypothetical protein
MLLYTLAKNNVSSNTLNVIRSMYAQLKSYVKSPGGLSDFFNCNVGTKQGCMLTQFLFLIFLNEFIDLLESANCKGIFVDEHVPNLLQRLFAKTNRCVGSIL